MLRGDEKSEAQLFLDHFFRALGHGGVQEAGATLEFRIAKRPGSAQLELIFVTGYLRYRVAQLPESVSVTLLTRTLITDFASRASDLDAVCAIAARAKNVLSVDSLHAKVYMVDNACALITSANATFAGMHRNAECGFEIRERATIDSLREHFANAFGAKHTPKPWKLAELEELKEPVALLRKSLPRMPRLPSAADQPARLELPPSLFRKFIGEFSGWLRLTLEGVAALGKTEFSLDEIFTACAPIIARNFPNNKFPNKDSTATAASSRSRHHPLRGRRTL